MSRFYKGIEYINSGNFTKTKKEAKKIANTFRKAGYGARVIKVGKQASSKGYIGHCSGYGVYVTAKKIRSNI